MHGRADVTSAADTAGMVGNRCSSGIAARQRPGAQQPDLFLDEDPVSAIPSPPPRTDIHPWVEILWLNRVVLQGSRQALAGSIQAGGCWQSRCAARLD